MFQSHSSFLRYDGELTTYVTFIEFGKYGSLYADDQEVQSKVLTYDFDIYSKGNYLNIIDAIENILDSTDFIFDSESADFYETDTGYYHKTLTYKIEK